MSTRVLILNIYSRNSLAIINGLRNSFEIYGGCDQNLSVTFLHNSVKKILKYHNPEQNLKKFSKCLLEFTKKYNFNYIIPTGTDITNACSKIKLNFEKKCRCKLLCSDYSLLANLAYKDKFCDFLKKIKINQPQNYTISEIKKIKVKFPLVAKPKDSYAAKGILFFKKQEDLIKKLKEKNFKISKFVFQEKIEGDHYDFISIFYQKKIYNPILQKREITQYDFGGGGIGNLALKPSYKFLKIIKKIIDKTKYEGPIMFDLIRSSKNKKFYFIECNPKFWGASQLAIECNANMSLDFIKLLEKKKIKNKPLYNIYYKWIFPDILVYIFSKPLTIKNIVFRFFKIFKKVKGFKTKNNLNYNDIKHNTGLVFSYIIKFIKIKLSLI